ncbi:MAG: hypothetical protein IJP32_09955 [Clostridia bacterium]|nr:hypothetical protein [Clostridia bacterium]MBQ9996684.1 hypothetical protein [Clostridia bacterium]
MKFRNILSLILVLGTLTSCGLLDRLGFDTYDYMSESVTKTHDASGETAVMLEELLMILVTDSPVLPTFDNMSDAITFYRDAVLEHLLASDYAKYSGNGKLIERAMKQYPEYQITQVLPELEFEATMYRCFGGDVMITHKDGNKFRYLPGVGVYIPMLAISDSGYTADITSLAETEKTYRVRFKVKSVPDENGNVTESEEYFALVIKREDETLYIKKLLHGNEVN